MGLEQVIKIMEDCKAREEINADQAKANGDREKYFYHLGLAVGYGSGLRYLKNLTDKEETKNDI
jgi:hypothetical protein